MNVSNLNFETKKKYTLTIMASLAVILALCIVTVAVAGIYRLISSDSVLSNGLSADQLTDNVVTKEDAIYGSLILVNSSHEYTFPKDNEHLVNMYAYKNNNGGGNYGLLNSSVLLHEDAAGNAHKMLNKMCSDISGADFVLASAYRTAEEQTNLPNSTIGAGFSDHHTGYCFTIKRPTTSLSPEDFEWLHQNAHNYGFVIRYPDTKADATGVSGYTNCLRYVGVAHANFMKQNNLCLEEYIDYLKANAKDKPLGIECANGEKYFVYYYPFEGMERKVSIPKDADKYPYEISGTNDGGIIVTIKVK